MQEAATNTLALKPQVEDGAVVLELFDRLPTGCLAFTVPDHSCLPLIKRGEVAVIDPTGDRTPIAGALYLHWSVNSYGAGRLRIVENYERQSRVREPSGLISEEKGSIFVDHNRPRHPSQWPAFAKEFGSIPMGDGPWCYDLNCHRDQFNKLIGRVVGMLVVPEIRL